MRYVTVHFTEIGSTQDYAKSQEEKLMAEEAILYVADQQTAGRGTHGRTWLSPAGNIYATFSFLVSLSRHVLHYFPQVTAYSIAQGLMELGLRRN